MQERAAKLAALLNYKLVLEIGVKYCGMYPVVS